MSRMAKLLSMVALTAMPLLAVQPASAATFTVLPAPNGTLTAVNNGSGDQTDPHVSGDEAAYTSFVNSASTIRYYNFLTGQDTGIPNAGSFDDLSDVDNGRVVFARTDTSATAINLFDIASGTTTVLAPQSGSSRNEASVGGNTVAWQDLGYNGIGEIVAYDIPTGTVTRLTNDTLNDQTPAVSPDGNVIVWEKCDIACYTWEAVKQAVGSWATGQLTTAGGDVHPDTDGKTVVYSRAGGGVSHIFYQPVGGGTEQTITLPGSQQNPSISGNLVAFEGTGNGGTSDIYIADPATGNVYQITNTSTANEHLSDITVSPSGLVRLVWEVASATTGYDVYAYSYQYGDTTPPVISVPGNMTMLATSNAGALVNYTVTVTDSDNSPDQLSAVCGPITPGGLFPVGTTTVTCVATDPAGNRSSASFTVTVTYDICALYDQSKAVHSGATVPIKAELCDPTGADISSSSVSLTATGVTQLSTNSPGTLESPGNSNPDNNFRFDSTIGTSGGYIFNLGTAGMATGTYALSFTATADPNSHSVQFQVK